MGTHPIFESDFDCLTDSQSVVRLSFKLHPPAARDQLLKYGFGKRSTRVES